MTDRILPDEGHPCRWCEFAMCANYDTYKVRCTKNAPGPNGFPTTAFRCGQFSLDEASLNKHIGEIEKEADRLLDYAYRDRWLAEGKPSINNMAFAIWTDDMIAEWEAAKAAAGRSGS